MNRNFQNVVLLVLFRSCVCDSETIINRENVESMENFQYTNGSVSEVSALLYKTANKFYCKFKNIENAELIIYGTKGWSFPKQTVNLTLSFPGKNKAERSAKLEPPYIITGFTVILLADGKESQGFITGGGILQESISLTFVCTDVSLLVYEFWLYGIRQNTPSFQEAMATGLHIVPKDMCSPSIYYV
ncbi:hypothetical protein ABMA28_010298 [Loxostege sticticalis]|uniref:Uncharacterized protein n=1 Tax=Loxostege sticticalis TaxID=481309 RepID=A0ABD0SAC6_LOXSC